MTADTYILIAILITCGIVMYYAVRRTPVERSLDALQDHIRVTVLTPVELYEKNDLGRRWEEAKLIRDDAEFLKARDALLKEEPRINQCRWFDWELQVQERLLLRTLELLKK
jgi:hypothetical protein